MTIFDRPTGSLLACWQEVLRFLRLSRPGRIATLFALLATSPVVHAQDAQPSPPPHDHTTMNTGAWEWVRDANVFFGLNYQRRKFTDFTAWESQNWFMLSTSRQIGSGRLAVNGMVSLEPFTLEALGSPQVFQTGE